jgi:hypothetical protein
MTDVKTEVEKLEVQIEKAKGHLRGLHAQRAKLLGIDKPKPREFAKVFCHQRSG